MRVAALSLASILAGCISMQTDEEWLRSRSNSQLCESYHSPMFTWVSPLHLREELERRNALTADEWSLVEQGKIAIDMSPLAVTCAWGKPDDVNRTVTAAGVHEQWVFCETRCSDASYVYFESGRVVSIQN